MVILNLSTWWWWWWWWCRVKVKFSHYRPNRPFGTQNVKASGFSRLLALCRVFILIFLRQTVSLGSTVLQPFCCSYSWCISLAPVLKILTFSIPVCICNINIKFEKKKVFSHILIFVLQMYVIINLLIVTQFKTSCQFDISWWDSPPGQSLHTSFKCCRKEKELG